MMWITPRTATMSCELPEERMSPTKPSLVGILSLVIAEDVRTEWDPHLLCQLCQLFVVLGHEE